MIQRAIAAALNLRTFLRIVKNSGESVHLNLPNINTCDQWSLESVKNLSKECE